MARWFACIVAWLAVSSLLATEAPIDLPEGYELAEIDPADWRTPPLLTRAALPAAPPTAAGQSAIDAFPSTLIAGCVNAISGHFLDSEIDLIVPGPVPLVVQRHYYSGTGRWRFRHMPHLRVAPSQGEHHLEAYYRDDDGSGMGYRAPLKEHLFCIPGRLFRTGFTNCSGGEISGQTNWKNSWLSFVRQGEAKRYLLRSLGDLIAITDPLGHITHFTYDRTSVLTITKTDPAGQQEIKIHDALGRLSRLIRRDPCGAILHQENYAYDQMGRRTALHLTLYGGRKPLRTATMHWAYDAMGREVRCTEAVGMPEQRTTYTRYTTAGERKEVITPNGVTLSYSYDLLSRLSSLTSSDGTIDHRYTYDPLGRPTCVEDAMAHTKTHRTYDLNGNLVSETLGHGATLTYDYDRLGRLLSLILPDQSACQYRYNAHHLLEVERLIEGEVTYVHRYTTYDLCGHPLREELIGQVGAIAHTYDQLQQHCKLEAPHWKEYIPEGGYDPVGNLLTRQVTDPQGEVTYRSPMTLSISLPQRAVLSPISIGTIRSAIAFCIMRVHTSTMCCTNSSHKGPIAIGMTPTATALNQSERDSSPATNTMLSIDSLQ